METLLKKVLLTFTLLTIFSSSAMAEQGFWDKLKGDLRPHITKYLGYEMAQKLLGDEGADIKLPVIPKVVKSNKDFNSINDDERMNKISKDKREKLNYFYVKELYESARNQPSTSNDLAKWMNVVSQGGSLEGVYHALVLDNTYAGLENFDQPASAAAINYAVEYLDKYLNKAVTREKLEGSNFFTLKRVVTERTIEAMNALAKKRSDLNDWYAVLAHDMASTRPEMWTNKIRKSQSKVFHKKWANKAPYSFVSSEVIIKVHKTFNYLKNQ